VFSLLEASAKYFLKVSSSLFTTCAFLIDFHPQETRELPAGLMIINQHFTRLLFFFLYIRNIFKREQQSTQSYCPDSSKNAL